MDLVRGQWCGPNFTVPAERLGVRFYRIERKRDIAPDTKERK